jgi:hypothetical protein
MRRLCAIGFLLPLFVPGGCVGPGIVATAGLSAAQAGVSEFTKGRLKTAWDVPLETMFQVTHSSLRKLGYTIEGERSKGNEWFIASRELDGTAIDVYLRRSTSKVTLVSIRVGMFGDQPLSRLITDTIDRQLKEWNETDKGSQAAEPAAPQTGS